MPKGNLPRILVVGPLPPPICGTAVSFQLFCNEIQRHTTDHQLEIINSAPRKPKERNSITSASNYAQMWRICRRFFQKVASVDLVLLFGSDGFLLLMVPLLLTIAKIVRKPCYVRAFGGSLDRFSDDLNPVARRLLLFTLRHTDGLIVQTEWLYKRFSSLLGDRVYLVPGYRPLTLPTHASPETLLDAGNELRLIFLGIVKEEKGIFVLLESLRKLYASGKDSIKCDIFGPISEPSAGRFKDELPQTKNAAYRGILNPEDVIPTLQTYDVLVLPTFYEGEGHPGVIIEAMMAGIPVISTAFRSIPELIEDRTNGLLVIPQNANSLVEAINILDNDRQLLAAMGRINWDRRMRYDARKVIPLILQPLGVDIQASPSSLAEAY